MPVSGLLLTPIQPNSGVVVLPRMIAPARRRRATIGIVGLSDVAAAQMGAVLELHAAHGLVVLDRHRHAVQRPDRLALGQRAIGGFCAASIASSAAR